mgnify:CR=1 FL=1
MEKNIKEKYFSKMVIVPLISLAIGVFGSIMKINTSLLISLIGGTFLLKGGYSYYKYQKHKQSIIKFQPIYERNIQHPIPHCVWRRTSAKYRPGTRGRKFGIRHEPV